MINVKYVLTHPNARVPKKAHDDDAGFDLFAVEDYVLQPQEYARIPTGLRIELPRGTEAQVRPRSGLAANHGVTVLNTPGTIDAGYRGEVMVIMINHGKEPFPITPGLRIAQMVIKPIYEVSLTEVTVLEESERGSGGFGSSGKFAN